MGTFLNLTNWLFTYAPPKTDVFPTSKQIDLDVQNCFKLDSDD